METNKPTRSMPAITSSDLPVVIIITAFMNRETNATRLDVQATGSE
jgi:hypothetical protein